MRSEVSSPYKTDRGRARNYVDGQYFSLRLGARYKRNSLPMLRKLDLPTPFLAFYADVLRRARVERVTSL